MTILYGTRPNIKQAQAMDIYQTFTNIKQSQAMKVAMGLFTHEKWGWLPEAITCFCA